LRSKLQVEFLRKYRLSETVDISRAVLTVRWNVTLIISGARAGPSPGVDSHLG